jgi:hypothetical protein
LSQTKLDLADIFREHGHQLGPLWGMQKKVVRAITRCRTALLGGHIYECRGQNLSLHPHIHMIIPGGGLSAGNADWVNCSKDFFANVRAMSLVFRAKFVKMIRQLYRSKRLTFCDSNRHLENPSSFQDLDYFCLIEL